MQTRNQGAPPAAAAAAAASLLRTRPSPLPSSNTQPPSPPLSCRHPTSSHHDLMQKPGGAAAEEGGAGGTGNERQERLTPRPQTVERSFRLFPHHHVASPLCTRPPHSIPQPNASGERPRPASTSSVSPFPPLRYALLSPLISKQASITDETATSDVSIAIISLQQPASERPCTTALRIQLRHHKPEFDSPDTRSRIIRPRGNASHEHS